MSLNHRRKPISLFLKFTPALVLTALSLLAGTPAAYTQVDRAVLEGTVSDPSGSVIAGAVVKVVAVETGLSEQQPTNSKGYYRISGLAVGSYTVTARPALWTSSSVLERSTSKSRSKHRTDPPTAVRQKRRL